MADDIDPVRRSEVDPAADAELATADLFTGLAHRHRRLVLSRLLNAGSALSVDDLATYVAKRDRDISPSAGDERYQRMLMGLRHTHLPILAELGFVEYDRDRRHARVTPNEIAAATEKYIHLAAQDEHLRLARQRRQ